ncbi:hypothetical protein OPQ81_002682 [Rhizoctonia solani]|nr:hypothetical protein OPQ81_002682 [Rhizoctonia solani]
MTVDQQLYALTSYLDNAAHTTEDWRTLPSEQQAAVMHDAWFALAAQIGNSEFQNLSPNEQLEVDFLAWAGCCMHKELNAAKGGTSRMAITWEELGLKPPITLLNKYESMGKAKGTNDHSMRGGIKVSRLAGAIFNNKDDKKGYQSTVDDFFEHHFGYSSRFADISNTRFGSYCDAAMMLILHLEKYKQLVRIICLAKLTPGFTNIESNVLKGLEDIPTLTELVVLVLPDAIYNILSLIPILPNIQPILVAFFQGALETWEQFTSEFETSGLVAQATETQWKTAWIPATNDISEGALGQCRQMLRRAPTMTDNQRNARAMWSHNHTFDWAKQELTNQDDEYIRQESRHIDASGENKKLRADMNAALEEQETTKSKLTGVELKQHATYEELFKMKILDLDLQIDKLREAGDKHVRAKSTLRNKDVKVREILAGLKRIRTPGIDVIEDTQSDVDMESESAEPISPDNMELYHPNEVVF